MGDIYRRIKGHLSENRGTYIGKSGEKGAGGGKHTLPLVPSIQVFQPRRGYMFIEVIIG
jgi:hypothetical protein